MSTHKKPQQQTDNDLPQSRQDGVVSAASLPRKSFFVYCQCELIRLLSALTRIDSDNGFGDDRGHQAAAKAVKADLGVGDEEHWSGTENNGS